MNNENLNPFSENYDAMGDDNLLIDKILKGNKSALDDLILRHQAWIYNIAVRMILDPVEAEDITQEILIKIITKLSTYDSSKSAFRTWLYRIVANHVLNLKMSSKENTITEMTSKNGYKNMLNEIKDTGLLSSPERYSALIESRTYCFSGILICLDPRQRLVFILGALFNVSDKIGSEILLMSRDNFRKILSRSREKIYNFFNQRCSLLDENNTCTCSHHADYLKNLGIIKEEDDQEKTLTYKSIGDLVEDRLNDMEDYYSDFIDLYRDQPMINPPDLTLWLKSVINTDEFKEVFLLH